MVAGSEQQQAQKKVLGIEKTMWAHQLTPAVVVHEALAQNGINIQIKDNTTTGTDTYVMLRGYAAFSGVKLTATY